MRCLFVSNASLPVPSNCQVASLYHNLYLPVRRLQGEAGVSAPRHDDLAQTPLQRLQARGMANPQRLALPEQWYVPLNPLHAWIFHIQFASDDWLFCCSMVR